MTGVWVQMRFVCDDEDPIWVKQTRTRRVFERLRIWIIAYFVRNQEETWRCGERRES